MKITDKLKERFCKDYNVPIRIFEEPYFTKRIELHDKYIGVKNKYERFINILEGYNNEQEYLSEYNQTKDDIINYIKNTEGFKKFNEDTSKFYVNNYGITQKDIFKSYNIDRELISIDMVKGNFTSLKHYDKSIFGESRTYEDFVRKFTDNEHFIESKYIRQVIFGTLNPKKQVKYQKHLMGKVIDELLEIVDLDNIKYFTNDEIVIDVTDMDEKNITQILNLVQQQKISLRIERFKLRKVEGTKGYAKIFKGGGIEFKCLDSLIYPFVLRYVLGEEVQDEDRMFIHEGLKSKITQVPEIYVDLKW